MSYSRNSSQDLIYNSYSNTYELASRLYTLTINPMPADSNVIFQGGTTSGRTVSGLYDTIVYYTVLRNGYITKNGNFTLNHDETLNIVLNNDQTDDLFRKGGGGGKATYLKLNGNTRSTLYAWYNGSTLFYTTSRKPSVYEPLYNNEGVLVTGYKLSGKSGANIIIEKLSDHTKSQYLYTESSNIKNIVINNNTFYQNGGGGGGAQGEDWTSGANNRRNKGGAGGGLYILNVNDLSETSINGKNAGSISNGEYPDMFPLIYSGKGGASGIDNGATILAPKTNRLNGGGASGNSSAINPSDDQSTAYMGSGGGGAGGDEDASGGKAGAGSSTYVANTTGENGYNYHTTATQPEKRKWTVHSKRNQVFDVTNLGKGGNAYNNAASDVIGTNGWIYMYKFEKIYQTFDMGRIGADPEAVTEIIDGMQGPNGTIDPNLSESQTVIRTIDGTDGLSNSQEITETINGDQVLYEEQWKDCGNISDTNIEETIRLGGI